MEYEKEYHCNRHKHLFNYENYYKLRSKLALYRYFKNILLSNKKVLEYGCGMGQNIYLINNAIGYDISKFSLKFCKGKGIKTISNIDNIEDNSIDIVFTSHVLEHVENPFETLLLLNDKLKKNGLIIIVLPVEKVGKAGLLLDINQHLYSWTFKTINNLLIKTGFNIKKNKVIYGTAYKKLSFIKKFKVYDLFVYVVGFLLNKKEMLIIGEK